MILRLRCPCQRNLADVKHSNYDPAFTGDGLAVTARPNVHDGNYRPWPRVGDSMQARTYSWRCRCGRSWERRHEHIRAAWDTAAGRLPEYRRYNAAPAGKHVVTLILGQDV